MLHFGKTTLKLFDYIIAKRLLFLLKHAKGFLFLKDRQTVAYKEPKTEPYNVITDADGNQLAQYRLVQNKHLL